MNRRKFTFAAFLGLLGIKTMAQEPIQNNGPLKFVLEPSSCTGLDFKVTKCEPAEDEEYCPLGHVQKPEYSWLDGHPVDHPAEEVTHHPEVKMNTVCSNECMIPTEPVIKAYDTYRTNLHICSTCGIVYIPRKAKAID